MSVIKPGKYGSKLVDKNVLVLGGTSGIGFAVAEAAWEFGARVTVSGTSQTKIDLKISETKSNNSAGDATKLRGFQCDLATREDLERNLKSLFDFATDGGQIKIDHLVFCAGDSLNIKPLEEVQIGDALSAPLVRGGAPIIIGKLCLNHGYIHSLPSSSFTLTSGLNATRPGKGWTTMAGAVALVDGVTKGLAVDMAPVRLNCVSPGAVHTELLDRFGGGNTRETLSYFSEKSLTKTVGRPEDTAEAYLYSMRDQFVTASLIESNGGGLIARFTE